MLCKNCNSNESVKYSKYSNGEFCSKECSRSYSTKEKRVEINNKVSLKLKGYKHSDEMRKKVSINNVSRDDETKLKIKNSLNAFYKTDKGSDVIEKLRLVGKNRIVSDDTKEKMSKMMINKCKDINERIRLREIGRKGGFGKKGYTKKGTRFESFLEKQCFEFLENLNVDFIPHKPLPYSSRVSDIYMVEKNLWIELDGINREKKKKYLGKSYNNWLEKLKEYEEKGLEFKIIYTYEDFRNFVEEFCSCSSVGRAFP